MHICNGMTGNPAAEGTGYFFINKISSFQSFIVLGGFKCEKLANNAPKSVLRYVLDKGHVLQSGILFFSRNKINL